MSLQSVHSARWIGSDSIEASAAAADVSQNPAQRQAPELLAGHVEYDLGTRTFKFIKAVVNVDKRKPGPDPGPDFSCPNAAAPACGSFSDPARHRSNFGQLRVTTNAAFPDEIQMQAAGFLEGYLTAERIFDYAYNMKAWLFTQTNDSFAVGDWLFAQDNASANYWRTIGLLTAQGLSPGQVRSRIAKSGRCSALIKVTPDLSDILMGHVTWWGYASMLRLYKHYSFRLTSVSSADDWYLLGSGLVVTETSLDIYDHTRYNASYGTGPGSLLSWQRALAANLLAEDGAGWAELAALHNSGSYNNQYLIVDLNRFSPGQELQPGLLTVMEIIPAGATDLASLRALLRSNAFGARPADPLAADSPWEALCGRGDLDPEDPDVYGCYDGKVTNYRRALALSADAINGPTTSGGQRPFAWADHPRFERIPHRGMLEVFDTAWEEQAP
eukprot:XP_001698626.1 predicted protein [Chlamydomonas reinhardtii]